MNKKTTIKPIYIEPEDEITSVIERIKKNEEPAVYIVVPERLSLLQSLVNLRLLAKFTDEKKQELILITTDPIIQNLASKINISVRKTLEGNNLQIIPEEKPTQVSAVPPAVNWWGSPLRTTDESSLLIKKDETAHIPVEKPVPETKKTSIEHAAIKTKTTFDTKKLNKTFQGIGEKIVTKLQKTNQTTQQTLKTFTTSVNQKVALTVLGLLGSILILGACILIPHATITLYPKTENFDQEFTIQATDLVKENNYMTRQIPASFLEVFQEGGSKVETTGEKFIGTKARGTIAIKNKRSQIVIKAGTVVTSSEGVKFVLLNDTTVNGAYVDDLGVTRTNQNPNVPVEAVSVGDEGNIKASDFNITGYNSSLVWGESYRTFTGGSSRKVKVLSQNDANTLAEDLKAQVFSKAYNDLQTKKTTEQKIPAESIKTEILEENWSVKIGEEAEEASLYIKIRTTGIAITESDIQTVLEKSFDNVVPGNYLVVKNSKSTWYELTSIDEPLKAINFTGGVKALLVPYFDEEKFKKQLVLKTPNQVQDLFKTTTPIEFVQDPTFSFWPINLGRMPLLPGNITFDIQTIPS